MTKLNTIDVSYDNYNCIMELPPNDNPAHKKVTDTVSVTHPIDDKDFVAFMKACSLAIKEEEDKGNSLVTFTGKKDTTSVSMDYSK